jgi:hypothetical protein
MARAAALLADDAYEDVRPSETAVDQYGNFGQFRESLHSTGKQRVDTGLAPGLCIETTMPLNRFVAETIMRMHDLKALRAGWDGYGAKPVAVRVFTPALTLALHAIKRGWTPSVVPLADGGLGLRWEHGDCVVELDVMPDDGIEAYVEGFDPGVPCDRLLSLREAESILSSFCRV